MVDGLLLLHTPISGILQELTARRFSSELASWIHVPLQVSPDESESIAISSITEDGSIGGDLSNVVEQGGTKECLSILRTHMQNVVDRIQECDKVSPTMRMQFLRDVSVIASALKFGVLNNDVSLESSKLLALASTVAKLCALNESVS